MFNIKKTMKVVLAINYVILLITTFSIVVCSLLLAKHGESEFVKVFGDITYDKGLNRYYMLGFAMGAFAFLATNISFFFSGLNIERKWKDLKSFGLVESGFIFTVSGLIPLYTGWTGFLLSLGKWYTIGGAIVLLLFIAQIILGYYFIVRTNKGGPKNGQK